MSIDGNGDPCYYCKEKCDGFAGNPGMWPILLAHSDEPGVMKAHHMKCVQERLQERDRFYEGIDQIQATAVKWAVANGGDTPLAILASKLRQLIGTEAAPTATEVVASDE